MLLLFSSFLPGNVIFGKTYLLFLSSNHALRGPSFCSLFLSSSSVSSRDGIAKVNKSEAARTRASPFAFAASSTKTPTCIRSWKSSSSDGSWSGGASLSSWSSSSSSWSSSSSYSYLLLLGAEEELEAEVPE